MDTILIILAIHSILFLMLFARISEGFRQLRSHSRETQSLISDILAGRKR